jgi:mannosidase alpha-like ER degradation enhancer 1
MFYHGYNNYMERAFPHDELKPLSGTWTDSLPELGGSKKTKGYQGLAMTLIDSLSTLAVIGDAAEFRKQVKWVGENIQFDVDVRVNLFELNIRMLGGLVSAHALASETSLGLMPDYEGQLLALAIDLGDRMMLAFTESSTEIPYAWINLQSGVPRLETHETCTAGVGTLLLEMGMLSHYSGDAKYFEAADRALVRLWRMRSDLCLLGNTLNVKTLAWNNQNSGIGAGIDSFYEYLMKSHILFGSKKYLSMFDDAYASVVKHLKRGQFYVEANMHSGSHSYDQFNSLSAFWPGLQVLVGDFETAAATQKAIFDIWSKYGALPERYLISKKSPHSTQNYYPLRPELLESTYLLYRSTGDPVYLEHGALFIKSLNEHCRVTTGFASIKNVQTKRLEDRMPSFFLAETVKYLYLLFDEENFLHEGNYVFTSEAHPLPVLPEPRRRFGPLSRYDRLHEVLAQGVSAGARALELSKATCPAPAEEWFAAKNNVVSAFYEAVGALHAQTQKLEPSRRGGDACRKKKKKKKKGGSSSSSSSCSAAEEVSGGGGRMDDFNINMETGGFNIQTSDASELVRVRGLGSSWVQLFDVKKSEGSVETRVLVLMDDFVSTSSLTLKDADGQEHEFGAIGAAFGENSLEEEMRSTKSRSPGSESVEAEILLAIPRNGCQDIRNNDMGGSVAYVARGGCTFAEKMKHVQAAGAVAMVVGNSEEEMVMMGSDERDHGELRLAALLVSRRAGNIIEGACGTAAAAETTRPRTCTAVLKHELSRARTDASPRGAGTAVGTPEDFQYRSLQDWVIRVAKDPALDAFNLHILT